MVVDKFGGRGVDNRLDVSLKIINKSFIRRDGSNTVTGSIDMMGNTFNNVANPTSDRDVATKAYVDSNSAADKVSKSGDTMTGDLLVNVSSDTIRLMGCTDLIEGKSFLLWLGNYQNQLHYTVSALPEAQTPVTMETTHGFLVKVGNTDVIQLGSLISVHKHVTMNDSSRIMDLPLPSTGGEPATKNYVDSRKPLITIWAEQKGVIENQKFEWSFGGGAEGRTHRHSGYTMMASGRILRMGLGGTAGSSVIPYEATVNVVVNGREKMSYGVTIDRRSRSATRRFAIPLELDEGDRINFRSASDNPNITSAVVSLLIQLDL